MQGQLPDGNRGDSRGGAALDRRAEEGKPTITGWLRLALSWQARPAREEAEVNETW